jgi:peptide deformylase
MVKNIVKDVMFLRQKSQIAEKRDFQSAIDLLDILKVNEKNGVGLDANMIGFLKRVIVFNNGFIDVVMFNSIIKHKYKKYDTFESCLSLSGERKTIRYQIIELEYQDIYFKKQINRFDGFTAQIIQHEVDHCNGIII